MGGIATWFISSYNLATVASESTNEDCLLQQFERDDLTFGNPPHIKIERPALVKQIQNIFLDETARKYYVIVGETGTGKSSVVQEAVSTLKAPKKAPKEKEKSLHPRGVFYFDSPENPKEFGTSLATALGFRRNEVQ